MATVREGAFAAAAAPWAAGGPLRLSDAAVRALARAGATPQGLLDAGYPDELVGMLRVHLVSRLRKVGTAIATKASGSETVSAATSPPLPASAPASAPPSETPHAPAPIPASTLLAFTAAGPPADHVDHVPASAAIEQNPPTASSGDGDKSHAAPSAAPQPRPSACPTAILQPAPPPHDGASCSTSPVPAPPPCAKDAPASPAGSWSQVAAKKPAPRAPLLASQGPAAASAVEAAAAAAVAVATKENTRTAAKGQRAWRRRLFVARGQAGRSGRILTMRLTNKREVGGLLGIRGERARWVEGQTGVRVHVLVDRLLCLVAGDAPAVLEAVELLNEHLVELRGRRSAARQARRNRMSHDDGGGGCGGGLSSTAAWERGKADRAEHVERQARWRRKERLEHARLRGGFLAHTLPGGHALLQRELKFRRSAAAGVGSGRRGGGSKASVTAAAAQRGEDVGWEPFTPGSDGSPLAEARCCQADPSDMVWPS